MKLSDAWIDVPKGKGFAVVFGGVVAMRTVSDTERSAKVNGLVALFGVMVRNSATDAEIDAAWAKVVEKYPHARIAAVEVRAP